MKFNRKRVIFTEKQAQKCCEDYQKLLGIQDWQITTTIERKDDFENVGSEAEICVVDKRQMAHMSLLDNIDFSPFADSPHDMEADILHELIHVRFNFIGNYKLSEADSVALEQAIEHTVNAIITIKRGDGVERRRGTITVAY